MKTLRFLLAALAPMFLVACGGSSTGKVSLLLTDASGQFSAAVVTITEIDLVGSGGTTVLSTQKVTTDLLTLANNTAKLVDGAVVSSGTYTQLRFVITGGYVEVPQAGGGSIIYASSPTYEGLPAGAVVGGTLEMPSYAQSGLKVDLPGGGVKVGTDAKVLLVDFDVGQSFGQVAGGSGSWTMHPVMTATEFELSGTVNVTLALGAGVTLPGAVTLGQFSAVLTNSAGSAKTLTFADAGGGTFAASFPYLIPGAYSLTLTAPAGVTSFTTSPAVPVAVTVASGQPTAEAFVVTAAH
ncbi:MAG TPA: DUF4382 domain-containing protein [Anaeromyxobacteraceae bacterium]|jgi:hypothetical protein|nr:DUF4382 domain-containing protein [Anaeromyxobacteraceae bacterium]